MKMELSFFLAGAASFFACSASAFEHGPITDCSNGCTIITCDQNLCAVNTYDDSGWTVASTYPNPSSVDSKDKSSLPVQKDPAQQLDQHKIPSEKDLDFVLSPTSAEIQYARICRPETSDSCSIFTVSAKGVSLLGPSI